jgi:hypothetical protein
MSEKLVLTRESSELSIYWASHLKHCQESGLTQAEYCRRNDLKYSVFHYWKRKLSKSGIIGSSANLVQLDNNFDCLNHSLEKASVPGSACLSAEQSDGGESPGLRLWVGSDYCIDVGDNFSSDALYRLLRLLRSL